MSQIKQKSDESADDYTIRIESEAAKAFSPLEEAVKNKACLSALSNGLRSLDIRRRIKEAEVKSFEKAARLAVKLEHIYDTTSAQTDQEDVTNFEVLALNNSTNDLSATDQSDHHSSASAISKFHSGGDTRNYSNNPHQNIVCHNCKRRGHIQRNCRAAPANRSYADRPTQRDNRRMDQNSENVQCYECRGRGHYANQCATRENRRQVQRQSQSSNSARSSEDRSPLNSNTAGRFPVHPSRQV